MVSTYCNASQSRARLGVAIPPLSQAHNVLFPKASQNAPIHVHIHIRIQLHKPVNSCLVSKYSVAARRRDGLLTPVLMQCLCPSGV